MEGMVKGGLAEHVSSYYRESWVVESTHSTFQPFRFCTKFFKRFSLRARVTTAFTHLYTSQALPYLECESFVLARER